MSWWVIILIVVAVIALLAFIGMRVSANEKKNAPQKLIDAKKAFEKGLFNECLELLNGAFYVPLNDKYEAADARVAHDAVELFEKVMEKMNLEAGKLTAKLKPALKKVSSGGGEVEEDLTKPLKDFLEKMDEDINIVDALKEALASGSVGVSASANVPNSSRGDLISDSESDVINQVGRKILKGDYDGGIALVDQHLANANEDFKLALYNQRGGLNFMKKDYQAAANDYQQTTQLNPSDATNWANLAEAYEKLNDKENAVATAQHVLSMPTADKDARKTSERIVKQLS